MLLKEGCDAKEKYRRTAVGNKEFASCCKLFSPRKHTNPFDQSRGIGIARKKVGKMVEDELKYGFAKDRGSSEISRWR